MANPQETLETLSRSDGHLGSCIVDFDSGELLASEGSPFDLEAAAAAHGEVVRAKSRAARCFGLDEQIEDILTTLETQYHLIRIVAERPSLFVFVVLDRERANLAMARLQLANAEAALDLATLEQDGWGCPQTSGGRLQLVNR